MVEASPVETSVNVGREDEVVVSAPWSAGKQRLRELWHSIEFLVRYKIGRLSARLVRGARGPETLIVIARKR